MSTSFANFYMTGIRNFKVSSDRMYLWVVLIKGCLTSGGICNICETPYQKGSFFLLSKILLSKVSVKICYAPSWYAIIAISLGTRLLAGFEFYI